MKAFPDNRQQAESLSLSREVCRSRAPKPATGPPKHRPLLHSASGPHAGLACGAASAPKLTKLQKLQDKKQTMDKILQELHSLRDQTLNNNSCKDWSHIGHVHYRSNVCGHPDNLLENSHFD